MTRGTDLGGTLSYPRRSSWLLSQGPLRFTSTRPCEGPPRSRQSWSPNPESFRPTTGPGDLSPLVPVLQVVPVSLVVVVPTRGSGPAEGRSKGCGQEGLVKEGPSVPDN